MKLHKALRPQEPGLLEKLAQLTYRSCPQWLGDFSFKTFSFPGRTYYRSPQPRGLILHEVMELASLVPGQQFNAVFVQKYLPGQNVHKHRDPCNNLDMTVIATYGDYQPAPLTSIWYPGQPVTQIRQQPGDVLVLPCTVNGIQGPPHEVTWPDSESQGTRYAIILNTIR